MTRGGAVVLAAALGALAPACSHGPKRADSPPAQAGSGNAPAEAAEAASPEPGAPLATTSVTIYFPSASGDGLSAESRDIVDTKLPAARGAQIIAALIEGPHSDALLPAVPSGTTLRHLWVRDDGSAYADFSAELATAAPGGSDDEILSVYAIVDSLTANVPTIRRVGILVEGRERDTLGHLDLRRPLLPDTSLVAQAKAPE